MSQGNEPNLKKELEDAQMAVVELTLQNTQLKANQVIRQSEEQLRLKLAQLELENVQQKSADSKQISDLTKDIKELKGKISHTDWSVKQMAEKHAMIQATLTKRMGEVDQLQYKLTNTKHALSEEKAISLQALEQL